MPSYETKALLPSRGFPYGSLLPGGEVAIRCLTTAEEKLTATSSSSTAMMDALFKRCAKLPADLPSPKLLTIDRFSLLIQLRVASYGPEYAIGFNCVSCRRQVQHTIHLETDLLQREKVLSGEPSPELFEVVLPISGKKLSWRWTTGEDEAAADKYRKSLGNPNDRAIYQLARQITLIDGEPESDLLKVINFIRDLPIRDTVAIRDAQQAAAFGAEGVEFSFICTHCRCEQPDMSLPLSDDFFRVVSPVRR